MKINFKSNKNFIINFNNKRIQVLKGENSEEIEENYLEEFKEILEIYSINLIKPFKTEDEANKDEEFLSLQEEAKALGIKGIHFFKDKQKLIEKINEFKNTNSIQPQTEDEANK